MGIDYIDKEEYRTFLVTLKLRLDFIDAFGKSGEEKIDSTEFNVNRGIVEKYAGKMQNPRSEFTEFAKNNTD